MKYPSPHTVPSSTIPTLRVLDRPLVSQVRFEHTFKVNIYSLIQPASISKKSRSQYWRRKHLNNWLDRFIILAQWSMDYRKARRQVSFVTAPILSLRHYLIFPQTHVTTSRPDFHNLLKDYRWRTWGLDTRNRSFKKLHHPSIASTGLLGEGIPNRSWSDELLPQPFFLSVFQTTLYSLEGDWVRMRNLYYVRTLIFQLILALVSAFYGSLVRTLVNLNSLKKLV